MEVANDHLPHITVCLTSISSRVATLHQTLESLNQQNYPNFSVRLYLSSEPYLLDEGIPLLTQKCRNIIQRAGSRVELHYVENIGPYRKLIPALVDRVGQDSLVATADDDTLYPSDWLTTLYHHYEQNRCIVCYRGHQMRMEQGKWTPYRSWMQQRPSQPKSIFNLPTGKDGVLYNTLFFSGDVLDIASTAKHARTVDDLWFKWHTALTGTPVFMINDDYRSNSLPETTSGTSLYKSFNESGSNDRAMTALEGLFSERYGHTLLELLEIEEY